MDFYQGVVVEYLRADRAVFVNTECCIQLNDKPNQDTAGPHWYCDAVAVDFRAETIFLCETSYATKLSGLIDRLKEWSDHWFDLHTALVRDCRIPSEWPVRPWLFIPEKSIPMLVTKLNGMVGDDGLPVFHPRITSLESVQPWKFGAFKHSDRDTKKPDCIPAGMQV